MFFSSHFLPAFRDDFWYKAEIYKAYSGLGGILFLGGGGGWHLILLVEKKNAEFMSQGESSAQA